MYSYFSCNSFILYMLLSIFPVLRNEFWHFQEKCHLPSQRQFWSSIEITFLKIQYSHHSIIQTYYKLLLTCFLLSFFVIIIQTVSAHIQAPGPLSYILADCFLFFGSNSCFSYFWFYSLFLRCNLKLFFLGGGVW